jgi:hypothetical protein
MPRKCKELQWFRAVTAVGKRCAHKRTNGDAAMHTTWKPHEKHGDLTERSDLPDSVFAFPKERKEPLTDASHVRNAIARFDQTIGISDEDRELAFANIKKAAEYYGVDMTEKNWKELGSHPSTGRTKEDRERSARKAAETRKEHARKH